VCDVEHDFATSPVATLPSPGLNVLVTSLLRPKTVVVAFSTKAQSLIGDDSTVSVKPNCVTHGWPSVKVNVFKAGGGFSLQPPAAATACAVWDKA
jgi:hypothetical protein